MIQSYTTHLLPPHPRRIQNLKDRSVTQSQRRRHIGLLQDAFHLIDTQYGLRKLTRYLGELQIGCRIERYKILFRQPLKELTNLLQVQMLTGSSQWLAIDLPMAIQVTLKRFQPRLGDRKGRRDVAF
jgi:hypothetical protein